MAFAWLCAHLVWSALATTPLPASTSNTPPAQRAYVWQRVWTPAVRDSVRAHAAEFAALDVLVAELSFSPAGIQVAEARPDWATLRAIGREIGLVVRAGPTPTAWTRNTAETQAVIAACRRALSDASAHGVRVTELQLDFDAATSRLREYRTLLSALRSELNPPRLVITTLPAWLRSDAFPALVATCDAFVLQVHAIDKPGRAGAAPTLCDTVAARSWIASAAGLSRPFRVALPCYGYRVAYSQGGNFLGLEAEGVGRTWPDGTRLEPLLADPIPIARLVRDLRHGAPAQLEAVCWFRLPNETDTLAWRWVTLATVMRGEAPAAVLQVVTTRESDGATSVNIVNTGNGDAVLPTVRVSWSGSRLLVADAIVGWTLERSGPDALTWRPVAPTAADRLRPGESRPVGWLRLAAPAALASRTE